MYRVVLNDTTCPYIALVTVPWSTLSRLGEQGACSPETFDMCSEMHFGALLGELRWDKKKSIKNIPEMLMLIFNRSIRKLDSNNLTSGRKIICPRGKMPLNPHAAGGQFLPRHKMMQKSWKVTETLAHGYISDSGSQWELSSEYQHD